MSRRHWTVREIRMLSERYPREGPTRLARETGRSEDSVTSLARRCGLRTPRQRYGRHGNDAKGVEPNGSGSGSA
jgi:hypothetical protein